MTIRSIPDDLYNKIVLTFLSKNRAQNGAARFAMDRFIADVSGKIPNGSMSHDTAHAILDDRWSVSAYIKETTRQRKIEANKKSQNKKKEQKSLLTGWQQKIKKEFSRHGIPTDDFEPQTLRASPYIKYIAFRMMAAGSFKTLVMTGVAIAFLVNVAASEAVKIIDYYGEKAIALWKNRRQSPPSSQKIEAQPQDRKSDPLPSPQTSNAPVFLENNPFGSVDTGKNKTMLDILASGHSVVLPLKSGTVLLRMEPQTEKTVPLAPQHPKRRVGNGVTPPQP
ncbi:MAG: hypothetical protein WC612_06600 [Bdellovibrionales bacterium]|jgi:hypothetical protein